MNNLIEIKVNEHGKQLVSARELYLGLGLNRTNWSRWYPTNVSDNSFFHEGVDFVGVRHNDEGNEIQDFAISLEFAKHIAMMARTEKSHEYRNYFIECEKVVKENKPTCIEDVLISSLQEMKALKGEVQAIKKANEETKEEIQGIRDVVALNSTNWRKDTATLICKMALKLGGYEHINSLRDESYKNLEQRVGVQLSTRLTNKRRRMAEEGVCKSKRDKLNKLDVIAEDKKILEPYLAIVKELAIKYNA